MNRFNQPLRRSRRLASVGLSAVVAASVAAQAPDGSGFDPENEVLEALEGVESDAFDTFNIQVQDTELVQVLQMLSLQSERNIIPSRNVSAVVSANLFDVTFPEALDAILKPNGFRWVEEGKFIFVYTQEEYARQVALERRTEPRKFELEHISAKDASEFAEPLLSDRGRLSFIGQVEPGVQPTLGGLGADSWAKAAILVVNDYPENLEKVSELLDEIDTAPRQVVVDATIASVSVTENDAFGVDFALIGNLGVDRLVSPLGPVADLIRGNVEPPSGVGPQVTTPVGLGADGPIYGGSSTPGNVAQGPGNLKLGLVAGDAAVFIRALDTVTDTMVLARPRLMALNRQRSQVLVGQRVAYLSTTATDTTTTQTVQYLDTGVKLMMRPFISKDDSIRLELYPSVSQAQLRPVTTGGIEGQIVVPDEFTNEISTNVRVRDGQTLVLGGLFQEQTAVTNSQVPFLGDVPLLGAAFSGHDNTVDRREIIFLITPNIVEDELIESTGREAEAFVASLRAGMRDGLLPFSREKMSSQHNQDAFQAARDGDTELAIYHLDNSLRLNPAQPDVMRMRARLTGQNDAGFFGSDMFRQVMTGMRDEAEACREEAARLSPATDPLAADSSGPGMPGTRSSEARYVDAIVEDLELPESAFEVVSVPAGMPDVEAIEQALFPAGVGSTEVVAATDGRDLLGDGPVDHHPSRVVADSGGEKVFVPRTTAWGRLWWLSRISGERARTLAASTDEAPADPVPNASAVATVVEED